MSREEAAKKLRGNVLIGLAGLAAAAVTLALTGGRGIPGLLLHTDGFVNVPLEVDALPAGERSVLTLVATRLLCAAGEACVMLETTARLECEGVSFTARVTALSRASAPSSAAAGSASASSRDSASTRDSAFFIQISSFVAFSLLNSVDDSWRENVSKILLDFYRTFVVL